MQEIFACFFCQFWCQFWLDLPWMPSAHKHTVPVLWVNYWKQLCDFNPNWQVHGDGNWQSKLTGTRRWELAIPTDRYTEMGTGICSKKSRNLQFQNWAAWTQSGEYFITGSGITLRQTASAVGHNGGTAGLQSCQPLCFVCSLLRPRALHYGATLMVISLRSPSEKQILFIFYPMRLCGHQIRQQPVVCVPFCVWDVGCATANRHSRFNQLTNRSIWFSSCSYASLPGETTSIFSHFKSPCWSEKPKASSRGMNLKKKRTPKFPGRVWYRTVSVHCTISIECQACEVQRQLLQFLAECTMSNNASTWSVTSKKEKR